MILPCIVYSGEDAGVDASAAGSAKFTEVCKPTVHPDTIDLTELGHCKAVRRQGDFHNGLVIGAKFRLSIGGSMVDVSVNFIKISHEEMVVATLNIMNWSPRMFKDGIG